MNVVRSKFKASCMHYPIPTYYILFTFLSHIRITLLSFFHARLPLNLPSHFHVLISELNLRSKDKTRIKNASRTPIHLRAHAQLALVYIPQ